MTSVCKVCEVSLCETEDTSCLPGLQLPTGCVSSLPVPGRLAVTAAVVVVVVVLCVENYGKPAHTETKPSIMVGETGK